MINSKLFIYKNPQNDYFSVEAAGFKGSTGKLRLFSEEYGVNVHDFQLSQVCPKVGTNIHLISDKYFTIERKAIDTLCGIIKCLLDDPGSAVYQDAAREVLRLYS